MKKIKVLKSTLHGKGVFAGEDIRKGERIQYIKGKNVKTVRKTKRSPKSMSTWFGVGRYVWIDPGQTPFRYLNHSCDSNAAVAGTKTLVALRDIKEDQEISIDYSMTDADPHWGLRCQCRSKKCRKHIQAIYTVPEEVFQRHMPYVPRYFQRLYERTHGRSSQGSRSLPKKQHAR